MQSMIADRARGAMRTRLKQLYVEQGYDPATAEALAIAEMSRRDRQRMAAEPTGFEGETGRLFEREILRSDPRRLAMGQPAPQMDEFRETPPTAREQAQYDPIMRSVQSGSGEPVVRFSSPMTAEDVAAQRGPEPSIYDRFLGRVREFARPVPPASAQASTQPPTYGTENFPAPTQTRPESFGASANRVIDRAMSTITGAPPAVAQPAIQTINGQPVVPSAPEPAAEEVTEPGFSGQSGRILEEALARARASTDPARTTSVTPARTVSRPTPSAPTQGPVAATQASGFFGNLFRDPYAGKSSRELYEEYQRRGDDDSAMYARAAARQLEEQKAAGMAHGGAAAGGKGGHHKDAAIMKALEIIHHMLRGR
jgi:hypothetical protein